MIDHTNGPPEKERPGASYHARPNQEQSPKTTTESHTSDGKMALQHRSCQPGWTLAPADTIPRQLDRRRAAARRMELYAPCGCRDPLTCRHYFSTEIFAQLVDGYRNAALHLRLDGRHAAPLLPDMQMLWRRGGADRPLAVEIAQRLGLAA